MPCQYQRVSNPLPLSIPPHSCPRLTTPGPCLTLSPVGMESRGVTSSPAPPSTTGRKYAPYGYCGVTI